MNKQRSIVENRIDKNETVIRIRKERIIRTEKEQKLEESIKPIREKIDRIYKQCSEIWEEFGFSLEILVPIVRDKEINLYLEFGNDNLQLIIGDIEELTKEFLFLKDKNTIVSVEGLLIPKIEKNPFLMKEFLKQLLSGDLENKVTDELISNIEGVWLGYDLIEEEVEKIEENNRTISNFLKEIA